MAMPPLPMRIAGMAAPRPGDPVATSVFAARVDPPLDAARLIERSGIASRYVAPAGTSFAELGVDALAGALRAARIEATALERIIFVSSLGGDELIPATANRIAAGLGLANTCDCFDLNNACMGFLSALDIAARSIATGFGPIGIVVVEQGSRYITPDDPRPYVVFGDAAVAAVVERAPRGGVLGSWLRNDGIARGNVTLAHAGLTHQPETIRFTASNRTMGDEAVAAVQAATTAVLAQAGLQLTEVDWVLPHQPNGALLGAIVQALGIEPARIVPVVHEYGSVGAASIPLSAARLWNGGQLRPGQRVLMVGVGAGISYGAMLLEVDG